MSPDTTSIAESEVNMNESHHAEAGIFKNAYTTNQISDTTGHHRVISFGDFNYIMRQVPDGSFKLDQYATIHFEGEQANQNEDGSIEVQGKRRSEDIELEEVCRLCFFPR